MRKIYTLFVLFLMLGVNSSWGQTANNYVYSTTTGAALINPTYSIIVGSGLDDGISGLQAMGFNFVYEGVTYTQFSANSNGLVRLGGNAVTNAWSNDIAANANQPKIMPMWDDLSTGSTGNVRTGLSGTAPNRIRVIDFRLRNSTNTTLAFNLRFQVRFYETTNVIEFVYTTAAALPSASVGIGGVNQANFISVNTTSHAASNVTANNTNTAWPGSGRSYTFTPPSQPYLSTLVSMTLGSPTWCIGETRNVTVRLRNDGTATWYASGSTACPAPANNNEIALSYKWNADPFFDSYSNNRNPLPNDVAPGQEVDIVLPVQSPNGNPVGPNNLSFKLIARECAWFDATHVSPSITVSALPTVDAGAPFAICYGGSGQLNGSATAPVITTTGASTFNYSGSGFDCDNFLIGGITSGMPAGATITSIVYSPTIGPNCTSWYEWDLMVNSAYILSGCNSVGLIYNGLNGQLANGQLLQLRSWDNDVYCDVVNMSVSFTVNYTITAAPPISYSWTPSIGLSNTSISNPIATPTSTQNYTITATANGCSATDDVLVTVNPIGTLTGTLEACVGGTSDLDAGDADWSSLPTGGSISVVGTNERVHIFNGSGSFDTPVAINGAQLLVIGAGGGGGVNGGGGGGAGGVYYTSNASIGSGSTSVTIGAGGSVHNNIASAPAVGGTTSFGAISAGGGGGGTSRDVGVAGANGAVGANATGSGGGGGGASGAPRNLGGSGTFNGGNGTSPDAGCFSAGGGGGGAGGNGTAASNDLAGTGGLGVQFDITGTALWYAGGGGGGLTGFPGCGGSTASQPGGSPGGSGVGGNGEFSSGTPNTGSGGGAENVGADGVVIIRYKQPKWTSSDPTVATVNELTGEVTALSPGSTTITYVSPEGCVSQGTFTVNENPTANAGGAMAPICQDGSSAPMGGSVGGGATGGTWSGGTGTWANANDPANAVYTPGTGEIGTITVTLTTSGGSCGTTFVTKNLTIDEISTPASSINNLNPSICYGGSMQLDVVGGALASGAQWEWFESTCGSTVIGTGASISVTPSGNTTYFVRATSANVCEPSACTNIAVTMPTASTNIAVNGDVATCVVNANNWIHFYNVDGRLIASVNSAGQDLGNVTATSLVAPSPYVMTSCTQPWDPSWFNAALARSFIITPTTQPTNPVSVRLYILDSEFSDYQTAALGTSGNLNDDVLTITDMDMTKHSGPSEDGNPLNNCGVGSTIYVPQSGSGLTSAVMGGFSGSYYIEYSISSFSEMFPMNSSNSPLPVSLTSFNANCDEDKVNITWTTASEFNASHYSLQTSRDGQTWTEVAQIEAAGTTSQTTNYFYQDQKFAGVSYYRLVQVDLDGASEIYGPISVDCEINESSMTVYPNPTDADFTVLIQTNESFENATIELVDLSGRSVEVKEMNILPGSTQVRFETNGIMPGTYIVRIKGENDKFTPIRVVVL